MKNLTYLDSQKNIRETRVIWREKNNKNCDSKKNNLEAINSGLDTSFELANLQKSLKVLKRAQFNKYGRTPHFSITRRRELYAQSRGSVKSLQQVLSSQNIYSEAEQALSQKKSTFRRKLKSIGNFNHSLRYFKKRGNKLFYGKDGKYGHSTRLAVAYFQFKNRKKIRVDGAFGEKSFEILREKISEECKIARKKLEDKIQNHKKYKNKKNPRKSIKKISSTSPNKKTQTKTVRKKVTQKQTKTTHRIIPQRKNYKKIEARLPKTFKATLTRIKPIPSKKVAKKIVSEDELSKFNAMPTLIGSKKKKKKISKTSKIILQNILDPKKVKPAAVVKAKKKKLSKPKTKQKLPDLPTRNPRRILAEKIKLKSPVIKKLGIENKKEISREDLSKKRQAESIRKRDKFNQKLSKLNGKLGLVVSITNNVPEISYIKNGVKLKLKPILDDFYLDPEKYIWNSNQEYFALTLDDKNIDFSTKIKLENLNEIFFKKIFEKNFSESLKYMSNRKFRVNFQSRLKESINLNFWNYGGNLSRFKWGDINFSSKDIRLKKQDKKTNFLEIYKLWKSKKDIIFKSKYNDITLTFSSQGKLKEVRKKDEIFNGIDSSVKTESILNELEKDFPQALDKDEWYDTTNKSWGEQWGFGWLFSRNLEEKISEYSIEDIKLPPKIRKKIQDEEIAPSFDNLTDENLQKFWKYTENGKEKTYKMSAEDVKNFLLFVEGKLTPKKVIFKKAWIPNFLEEKSPIMGSDGKTINKSADNEKILFTYKSLLNKTIEFKNFKEFFDILRPLSETKNSEDLLKKYREILKKKKNKNSTEITESKNLKKQLQDKLNIHNEKFSTLEYFKIAIHLKDNEVTAKAGPKYFLKKEGQIYYKHGNTTWTNISIKNNNNFIQSGDEMIRLKSLKAVYKGWFSYKIYQKYEGGFIDTNGDDIVKALGGKFVKKSP